MSKPDGIVKSGVYIVISNFLSISVSVLFVAYFARVFSKEEMAVFAILYVFIYWNEILGGLGLGTLLIKDASELAAKNKTTDLNILITGVFVYRTISIFIICLIWSFFCEDILMAVFDSNANVDLFVFVVWISFFTSCSTTINLILTSIQRFQLKEIVNLITFLTQRVFCVVGFLSFGTHGFYWGYLIATLLGLSIGLLVIRGFLIRRVPSLGPLLKASRSYLGLKVLSSGLDQLDRPIIAVFMGAEMLAGYHVAKRLYDNLCNLMYALIMPVGVKYGELMVNGRAELVKYHCNTISFVSHIFIPIGFFLMLIGKPLLLIYAGDKYASNSQTLIAFGFTFIGLTLWTTLREAALRLLAPRFLAYQLLVSTAITLFSYFALLPSVGTVGIPIAMGLGYFAGLLPQILPLKKQWDLDVSIKQIFMAVGCSLCIVIASILLPPIKGNIAQLVVGIFSSFVVYVSWIHFFGPAEIKDFLKNIYRRLPFIKFVTASK